MKVVGKDGVVLSGEGQTRRCIYKRMMRYGTTVS